MFAKTVAILNILAALGFAALLVIGPLMAQLSARMRFTELDRAGVINARALGQFHSSYGFGDPAKLDYRQTVPDWICASHLMHQEANAAFGLALAATNATLAIGVWARQRRTPVEAQ